MPCKKFRTLSNLVDALDVNCRTIETQIAQDERLDSLMKDALREIRADISNAADKLAAFIQGAERF